MYSNSYKIQSDGTLYKSQAKAPQEPAHAKEQDQFYIPHYVKLKTENERCAPVPEPKPAEKKGGLLKNIKPDDILLLVLLYLIVTSDDIDIELVIALAYIFFIGR